MKKCLLLAILPMMFAACGLKRQVAVYDTYPVTPGRLEVFQTAQQLPENRIQVGTVSVGDNYGLTVSKKCSYAACMEALQEEAKKMGGEFIYIVEMKAPSYTGGCYNITADIYRYK